MIKLHLILLRVRVRARVRVSLGRNWAESSPVDGLTDQHAMHHLPNTGFDPVA